MYEKSTYNKQDAIRAKTKIEVFILNVLPKTETDTYYIYSNFFKAINK